MRPEKDEGQPPGENLGKAHEYEKGQGPDFNNTAKALGFSPSEIRELKRWYPEKIIEDET